MIRCTSPMGCVRTSPAPLLCPAPLLVRSRTVGRRPVNSFRRPASECCHPSESNECGVPCEVVDDSQQTSTAPPSRTEVQTSLPAWALSSAVAAITLAVSWPALADTLLSIPGLVGDNPFREGAVSGFLLIFFSEIGDKTFFIALLLALKQNRTSVFVGTFGALAVMTVISVGLGQALHQIDDLIGSQTIPYDDILATALLVFFGFKTLKDASTANESAEEELQEAKEEVDKFSAGGDLALILSTFALVFAAEWGDKSFLATIALSAASSPTGVVTGAVAGHGVATALAVVGGRMLSQYIDERPLQYIGGSLFLVFAAATVFDIFVQHPEFVSGAGF